MAKEFKQQKLIGQYFHSYEFNNETKQMEIKYQGCIEGQVTDEMYICQLFSFADGSETNNIIVFINDMKDWKLYKTNTDMNAAYEKYIPGFLHRLEERDRKAVA